MEQTQQKLNRGFASMDRDEVIKIARKGGQTISQNREHMSTIGRKGGMAKRKKRTKKIYAATLTKSKDA
jgi:general stress protein YciG